MKPNEIRLILIIVAAVIVTALIQDWRSKHPEQPTHPFKPHNAQEQPAVAPTPATEE